jgi:hypothetical protein
MNIKYIIEHLKKDVNGIKVYFKYWHKWKQNGGGVEVLIDLDDLRIGRRLTQIVQQLNACDIYPYFKVSLVRFVRYRLFLEEYSYIALNGGTIVWHLSRKKRKGLELVVCSKSNAVKWKEKVICIDENINNFSKNIDKTFFFPILMHPVKRESRKAIDLIDEIIKKHKSYRIGIIFIGNTAEWYDGNKDVIHEKYKIPTRTEIINHIQSSFCEYIYRPESLDDLLYLMNNECLENKILIIDKFRLSNTYMELLHCSKFQIWTPGYIQPYCHNQIEGMACGAIPIYPHYAFYPGLVEGLNSFSYKNFSELDTIINNVITGVVDNRLTESMSKATWDLYRERFSEDAFKNKLNTFLKQDQVQNETYYICPGMVEK